MPVIKVYQPKTLLELKQTFDSFLYTYPSVMCRRFYRGQSNNEHGLITRIADKFDTADEVKLNATLILNDFKNEVKLAGILDEIYLPDKLGEYAEEYFWYFQAQHLGIPTPFLDWTSEWENAIYFCCFNKEKLDTPGTIWLMLAPHNKFKYLYEIFEDNINDLEEPMISYPEFNIETLRTNKVGEDKRSSQKGAFLFIPFQSCKTPVNQSHTFEIDLVRVVISSSLKKELSMKGEVAYKILGIHGLRFNKENIEPEMSPKMRVAVTKVRQKYNF